MISDFPFSCYLAVLISFRARIGFYFVRALAMHSGASLQSHVLSQALVVKRRDVEIFTEHCE